MQRVSRSKLAKTMMRLLNESPARQSETMQKTAAYLMAAHVMENGNADDARLLEKDLAREMFDQKGRLLAEVRTAFPLSDDLKEDLVEFLKKKTGAESVELDVEVDSSLISGLIITTSDYEIDLSAKCKLKQLAGLGF